MKTIIESATNISKYMFANTKPLSMTSESITTPDFIIGDMNSINAHITEGVTAPADWVGCKYTFDGTTWALNADWSEPTEPTEPV